MRLLKIACRRFISPIACDGVVIGSLMASFYYLSNTLAPPRGERFIEFARRARLAAPAPAESGFEAPATKAEARAASHARRM